MFRSKIFGGMSAEVLTIFNKSAIPEMLKGSCLAQLNVSFNFHDVRYTAHKLVPPGGVPLGVKIGVADSAYRKSTLGTDMPLWLPTALPKDFSNLKVRFFFFFGQMVTNPCGRGLI